MVAKRLDKVPVMTTDEEAEAFLAQDLSNLDFTKFRAIRFERQPKGERVATAAPKPRRRKTG